MRRADIAERVGCGRNGVGAILRAISRNGVEPNEAALEQWLSQMALAEPLRGRYRFKYVDSAYFIRSGDAVKIGESDNVLRRLEDLQSGSPHKLELIACFKGGAATEAYFHGRFKPYRIRREWFRVEGELAAFVAKISPSRKRAA